MSAPFLARSGRTVIETLTPPLRLVTSVPELLDVAIMKHHAYNHTRQCEGEGQHTRSSSPQACSLRSTVVLRTHTVTYGESRSLPQFAEARMAGACRDRPAIASSRDFARKRCARSSAVAPGSRPAGVRAALQQRAWRAMERALSHLSACSSRLCAQDYYQAVCRCTPSWRRSALSHPGTFAGPGLLGSTREQCHRGVRDSLYGRSRRPGSWRRRQQCLQARAESIPDDAPRAAVCKEAADTWQAKSAPPTFVKAAGKIVASALLGPRTVALPGD